MDNDSSPLPRNFYPKLKKDFCFLTHCCYFTVASHTLRSLIRMFLFLVPSWVKEINNAGLFVVRSAAFNLENIICSFHAQISYSQSPLSSVEQFFSARAQELFVSRQRVLSHALPLPLPPLLQCEFFTLGTDWFFAPHWWGLLLYIRYTESLDDNKQTKTQRRSKQRQRFEVGSWDRWTKELR